MAAPVKLLYLFILILSITENSNGILEWLFRGTQNKNSEAGTGIAPVVPKGNAPFEMKTTDDKFLMQSEEFKKLSPLDICHHEVIGRLRSGCGTMAEEELGKLSVRLLNCQLKSEKRESYECTDDMSLADCTKLMEPTMWNSYQIVSNRARAMCYGIRQQQFRLKAEYTVNRLLHTTQDQVRYLQHLEEGQEKINEVTADTLKQMYEGQQDVMIQNQALKLEQQNIHTYIAGNLKELTREKALIATGNKELAQLTENIKNKLDIATHKLLEQQSDQKQNHQEILDDLAAIREKAQDVWKKIDNSSQHILDYHNETTQHYQDTIENLKKVNHTINFVLKTVQLMREAVDQRLGWLGKILGGTGNQLAVLSTCALHLLYFLLAMIAASFLHTPTFSRVILFLLVPLNALTEVKHGKSLNLTVMTLFILMVVTVNWFMQLIHHLYTSWRYGSAVCRSPPSSPCKCANQQSHTAAGLPTPMVMPPPPNTTTAQCLTDNKAGLSTPELKHLITTLEKLCKSMTSPVNNIDDSLTVPCTSNTEDPDALLSASATEEFHSKVEEEVSVCDSTDLSWRHGETLDISDWANLDTPKDSPATPMANDTGFEDPESKPDIEQVRRHLLNSLGSMTPVSKSGRSTPSRSRCSTPVRNSPRRPSRPSTPKRPTCLGTTRLGQPCKLTCTEGSIFCHRHLGTPGKMDSLLT